MKLFAMIKVSDDYTVTSGWSMNFIAFDKFSTLSSDIGIGAGPNSF